MNPFTTCQHPCFWHLLSSCLPSPPPSTSLIPSELLSVCHGRHILTRLCTVPSAWNTPHCPVLLAKYFCRYHLICPFLRETFRKTPRLGQCHHYVIPLCTGLPLPVGREVIILMIISSYRIIYLSCWLFLIDCKHCKAETLSVFSRT